MRGGQDKPDIPIRPILEHYGVDVPLRGGWASVKCFIHDDGSPSAAVNLDANRFVCYAGCTDMRGEDAVGLIQLVESKSFSAALEEATRIAGSECGRVQRKPARSTVLFDSAWYSD